MKKIILSVFTALFLFSCGITKTNNRTDMSEGKKTIEERTITRPGDTVTIDIPNIRYKDTIIERVNYNTKTIARVIYDNDGNQKFDCIPAEIREELKLIREEFKNDIEDDRETKHEFNPQYFVYAIGFLAFILVFGMIIGLIAIKKIKSSIPGLISETMNQINK